MLELGEHEAAIYNLLQAIEFYPENAEIEYRLAGTYFILNETRKAVFHLKNAMKSNPEYVFILEELFPDCLEREAVKKLLKKIS